MAAIAFTKVVATDNEVVYSWTGDSAGTLAYATLAADAGTTSTIGRILASLSGQCNSNAKAVSALQTGESFVGTSGSTIVTNIQSKLVYTASTTGKAPTSLTAVDDGGTNNPLITLTPDGAASSGFLYITHVFSAIQ